MEFNIIAEPRAEHGTGASRRLRRAGRVPGILYGAHREPIPFSVDHNELMKKLAFEAFYSHVLTLELAGQSERVVLKDLQRHPVRPLILHLDLQRVAEDEAITMRVPLHFINESVCVGVKTAGGQISHLASDLEIECLPKDLPEYIEVDVGPLEVGAMLHASQLVLPPGVRVAALAHHGEDAAIVSVHAPRGGGDDDEAAAA